MSNPFDMIKLINNKSEMPSDAEIKENYVPFVINRNFSYTMDTVLIANEMNKHSDSDVVMQFKYYFHSVKKRKRYAKWTKPEKHTLDFKIVRKYYNYNNKNTELAMQLLTDEQLKIIKTKMSIGGIKKMEFDV